MQHVPIGTGSHRAQRGSGSTASGASSDPVTGLWWRWCPCASPPLLLLLPLEATGAFARKRESPGLCRRANKHAGRPWLPLRRARTGPPAAARPPRHSPRRDQRVLVCWWSAMPGARPHRRRGRRRHDRKREHCRESARKRERGSGQPACTTAALESVCSARYPLPGVVLAVAGGVPGGVVLGLFVWSPGGERERRERRPVELGFSHCGGTGTITC